MTTKVCRSCKLVLPLDQFSLVRGKPRARCKDCLKAESRADRERYKARNKVDQLLENSKSRGTNPDPLDFSRAACEHVRVYVERAIERWERATEMEAPPHVVALRQLAEGFVKEHPVRSCPECGRSIFGSRRRQRCQECASQRRQVRQRLANKRWKKRQKLKEGQALVMRARRDMAQLLRVLGLEWQEIADRMGLASAGAAYNMAHYDTYLPYIRDYARRKSQASKGK